MNPIWKCSPVVASSPEGAAAYVTSHIENSGELTLMAASPLLVTPGGTAIPWLSHNDLWHEVGWYEGAKQADPFLIAQVLHGRDRWGLRLNGQRCDWHPPVESILSLPAEVSEALYLKGDEAIYHVTRMMWEAMLRLQEETAVRIRDGRGGQHAMNAQLLALGYLHGENKLGEPQLALHHLTFPPARADDGRWLTYDAGAHIKVMAELGRRQLGEVMVGACC